MNRFKVWPFIYFPKRDVLLSTKRAYYWKAEDRVVLRGCILISILLRFSELVVSFGLPLANEQELRSEGDDLEPPSEKNSICGKKHNKSMLKLAQDPCQECEDSCQI